VNLVISHRSETRKNERVPNLLLASHFVYLSEQVGVVFEALQEHPFKVCIKRQGVGHMRAVRPCIICRIGRMVHNRPACLLG
jgi:hypothetical protein